MIWQSMGMRRKASQEQALFLPRAEDLTHRRL